MLILAIETSGRESSVALLENEALLRQGAMPAGQTAQQLVPMLQRLLADHGIAPARINLIAVGIGPGSFTGLRVGVTTAKTLAYAIGCDVIGIDTLDAIAAQVSKPAGHVRELHVVMDAQRRELFLGRYGLAAGENSDFTGWQRHGGTELIAAETWSAQLTPQTLVAGSGLKRQADRIPSQVTIAPKSSWEPVAETIGALAHAAWQSGRRDDLWKLVPTYIRPSYAEEKAKPNAECRVQNAE